VFVSFGAEIDRATIEKNTVVNALSRVGPGVRLRSGRATLAGANITTQAQADAQPGSPGAKVLCVSQAAAEFAEAVIEANEQFAKGYSAIARRSINNVKGISIDPNTELSEGEQKPRFGPNGEEDTDPTFRNRIIGQIFIEDSKDELSAKMGNRISLRADEGKNIFLGRVTNMSNNVIFHALEKNQAIGDADNLTVGDNITYGDSAIVHGGLQVVPGTIDERLPATSVGDNVTLGRNSVVFRSVIDPNVTIGEKSLIVNSTVRAADSPIPPRTTIVDDRATLNGVEW
jgi:carbonic anhydrase/acetyltransferase-like protein (isoleucine patch superfamily)